jgi:hypothetical protein
MTPCSNQAPSSTLIWHSLGIGLPYNVQRMVHVDINYNWEGVAEDNFFIEEKLGEGYCLLA